MQYHSIITIYNSASREVTLDWKIWSTVLKVHRQNMRNFSDPKRNILLDITCKHYTS